MSSSSSEDAEIAELSDVYKVLRQDANSITKDLLEGISMWRHAAFLLVAIGLLSFVVAWITAFPIAITSYQYLRPLQYGASLGLGIFVIAVSVWYRQKFHLLQRRYQALYAISEKLR